MLKNRFLNSCKANAQRQITAAFFGLVVAFIIIFCIYRHYKVSRKPFKGISRSCLKSFWPKSCSNSQEYKTPESNENIHRTNSHNEQNTIGQDPSDTNRALNMSERAASFRSVMTLPSYIQTARQTERVLGREGERAGMDVVVEFPKTAEEEEQRREEEMEALYQIRLARRRENEAREERRRLRREAQERGEPLTTRDIEDCERRITRELPGQSIEELRAEHDRLKRQRRRAVSAVSYADIGVARHDGTRLSLTNQDNEHIALLGDAASISASTQIILRDRPESSRSMSTANSDTLHNPIHHSTHSNHSQSPSLHFPRDRPKSRNPPQAHNRHTSSSSPMTQPWQVPRGSLRRASTPAETLNTEGLENTRLSMQSSTPLSSPPVYESESVVTAINSIDRPPEYWVAEVHGNEWQSRFNEPIQITSDDSRSSNGSSGAARNINDQSELMVPEHSPVNSMPQTSNSIDLIPQIPDLDLESLSIIELTPSTSCAKNLPEARLQ